MPNEWHTLNSKSINNRHNKKNKQNNKKAPTGHAVAQSLLAQIRASAGKPTKHKHPTHSRRSATHMLKKGGGDANAYRMVLKDACNRMSFGCRVPGQFNYPSSTEHVQGSCTFKADQFGNLDIVWIGQPTLSMWSSVVPTENPYTPYTGTNPNYYYATDPATLVPKFATFRNVGNGCRIKNLQAQLNLTGSISVARVPMGIYNLGPNALTNAVISADPLKLICGISLNSNGNIPASIQALPDSCRFTFSEFFQREVIVSNVPTSSRAFVWRETDNNPRTGTVGGAAVSEFDHVLVDQSGGATQGDPIANTADREAYCDMSGWTCTLIKVTGAVPSAVCIEVESAIHMEGTPQIKTTSAATFVPDNIVRGGDQDAAKIVSQRMKSGFAMVREIGNSLYENRDVIRGAANVGRLALTAL